MYTFGDAYTLIQRKLDIMDQMWVTVFINIGVYQNIRSVQVFYSY